MAPTNTSIRVTETNIFPIKACRAAAWADGSATTNFFMDARGPRIGNIIDRGWMLMTPSDNKFITQRGHDRSKLARVECHLLPNDEGIADRVRISADGFGAFILDRRDASAVQTIIATHDDAPVSGHIMSGDAAGWFQNFLGTNDVQLVYQGDDDKRLCDTNYARQPGQDIVSYADGFGTLLVSMATLRLLNSAMSKPCQIDNFRGNIVIDGDDAELAPRDESTWRDVSIGAALLQGVKICTRCKVTGFDQKTGDFAYAEIIRALAQVCGMTIIKNDREMKMPTFGENMVVAPRRGGIITVGDAVLPQAFKPLPG